MLGRCKNNGWSTPTHALLPGSPAIDIGNNVLAIDQNNQPLPFDQRGSGFGRVDGNNVDIGAFEVNTAPTLLSFTRQTPNSPVTNSDTVTFRATFSEDLSLVDAGDFAVDGDTTATITNVASVDAKTYDITVPEEIWPASTEQSASTLPTRITLPISLARCFPQVNQQPDQTFTSDNTGPQVESIAYDDGSGQRSVIRSVTVTFDSEVIIPSGGIILTTKSGVPITLSAPQLSTVNGKTRVTYTFVGGPIDGTGSRTDGNYRLRILDTHVQDLAGNALDGDRDGAPGAAQVDEFFRFFGDSDGDRDVDGQDYGRFGLTAFKRSGDVGFNPIFDSDGDGDVDGQDYVPIRNTFFYPA